MRTSCGNSTCSMSWACFPHKRLELLAAGAGRARVCLHEQWPGLGPTPRSPRAGSAELHRARQSKREPCWARTNIHMGTAIKARPMDCRRAAGKVDGKMAGVFFRRRRRLPSTGMDAVAGENSGWRRLQDWCGKFERRVLERVTSTIRPASRSSYPAPDGPSEIIRATPVVLTRTRFYVAVGPGPPSHRRKGVGRLMCIDPKGLKGDASKAPSALRVGTSRRSPEASARWAIDPGRTDLLFTGWGPYKRPSSIAWMPRRGERSWWGRHDMQGAHLGLAHGGGRQSVHRRRGRRDVVVFAIGPGEEEFSTR